MISNVEPMAPLTRFLRVIAAIGAFTVAAFALRAALLTLGSGSVSVVNDTYPIEPITQLRGWMAYSFGIGQVMFVIALTGAGSSVGMAALVGTHDNPVSRRLLVVSGIIAILMVLLLIIPVAIQRP